MKKIVTGAVLYSVVFYLNVLFATGYWSHLWVWLLAWNSWLGAEPPTAFSLLVMLQFVLLAYTVPGALLVLSLEAAKLLLNYTPVEQS